ncbi:hypothetical protein U0070_014416 [Myodes glareolus]|uniref:Uncharacterized protein n=1 Tax=Myodes glareolus TaxID=447135 RepID=A0AAW0J6F1_MYOGA
MPLVLWLGRREAQLDPLTVVSHEAIIKVSFPAGIPWKKDLFPCLLSPLFQDSVPPGRMD